MEPLSLYIKSNSQGLDMDLDNFFRYYCFDWDIKDVWTVISQLHRNSFISNIVFVNILKLWHSIENLKESEIYIDVVNYINLKSIDAGDLFFSKIKFPVSLTLRSDLRQDMLKPDGQVQFTLILNHKILGNYLNSYIHKLYSEVSIKDLTDTSNPSVYKIINFFDRFSSHVSWEILISENIEEVAKRFDYYLNVAKYLYNMQNYEALYIIFIGLNNDAIARLKNMFIYVRHMKRYNRYIELFDVSNKFSNYRSEVDSLAERGPGVDYAPIFVLIIKDLTFVKEIPAIEILSDENKIINESKLTVLNKILSPFINFRNNTSKIVNMGSIFIKMLDLIQLNEPPILRYLSDLFDNQNGSVNSSMNSSTNSNMNNQGPKSDPGPGLMKFIKNFSPKAEETYPSAKINKNLISPKSDNKNYEIAQKIDLRVFAGDENYSDLTLSNKNIDLETDINDSGNSSYILRSNSGSNSSSVKSITSTNMNNRDYELNERLNKKFRPGARLIKTSKSDPSLLIKSDISSDNDLRCSPSGNSVLSPRSNLNSSSDISNYEGFKFAETSSILDFAKNNPNDVSKIDRGRWFIQLYKVDLQLWSNYDVLLWFIMYKFPEDIIQIIQDNNNINGPVVFSFDSNKYADNGFTSYHLRQELWRYSKKIVSEVKYYRKNASYKNIKKWNKYIIAAWLEDNEMSTHIPSFLKSKIDGISLLCMDDNDIKALGITKLGEKIAIKRLKKSVINA